MSLDLGKLTALERDALKEVANIGAAHAATALSQIVEKKILISVSDVNLCPVEELLALLGGANRQGIAVHLKVLGDAVGNITLVLMNDDALRLVDILKGQTPGFSTTLSEIDYSGLKETGSILGAAYLRAIGQFTKLSLIPSVPDLSQGELSTILSAVSGLAKRAEVALCLRTEFLESNYRISGNFVLIPDLKSLEALVGALHALANGGSI